MLRNRLIPVVLMRNGLCVQSKGFRRWQALGNAVTIVQRLSGWASDELIYLDISREGPYDLGRDDTNFANRDDVLAIIEDVAAQAFMPLTVGGRIRTLDDVHARLAHGADKVTITTVAADAPEVLTAAADEVGSQCLVVGLDVRAGDGGPTVFVDGARRDTGVAPADAARRACDAGAGELLVQFVDRDGAAGGYDLRVLEEVVAVVDVPVIALGGVGDWTHLAQGLDAGASAVAAANIFQYSENSVLKAKRHLFDHGYNVRAPDLLRERDL